MLAYLVQEVRAAHSTVWWVSGFVAIALVCALGWSMYQTANKTPRASMLAPIHHV